MELVTTTEIKPYLYQSECLGILHELENSGRDKALVVMATGLGKTVTAALFTRVYFQKNENVRCLFLCHQNDILTQARLKFHQVIGSDADYGFFHGDEKTKEPTRVLFASLQTMRDNLQRFSPDEFDLVIVDETHHIQAPTYEKVIRYFQPRFLMGMTATPNRKDELDIREIYGPEVYNLSLIDALARDLLAPIDYRLMTDEINSGKYLETPKGRFSIARLNRKIFAPKRDEEISVIIQRHIKDVKNPRAIVFCSSVEHCERMAEIMPGAVPLHAELSRSERRTRLELYRQGVFHIVVAVDVFNEGIDIPEANIIVFLRSTSSPTIYLQQLGRGLRPHKDKSKVLVLDFVGNCDRIKMVYDLWKEVREWKEAFGEPSLGTVKTNVEPFLLNVDTIEFREKVIPLVELIERLKLDFYPTWQEAADAAKLFGFKSSSEYATGYPKDPRLPSRPVEYYGDLWPGWDAFFERTDKKEFYETLEQARTAALKLGITGKVNYDAKYKQDLKLPSRPDDIYSNEWKGWKHFISGTERKIYATLFEAKEAVKGLGVKSSTDYWKKYKNDKQLPRYPDKRYKDWKNWEDFLGLPKKEIYSFNEAKAATQLLGIKTWNQYLTRYAEDPKLPSQPNRVYKDEWKGANDFLDTKRFNPVREYYKTLAEASVAAKALGVTDFKTYKEKYKQDNKLTSDPARVYKDDWVSWSDFLK